MEDNEKLEMTLAERMKKYEADSEKYGCRDMRAPVVIRLDGCHFHTWVKQIGFKKPFDPNMTGAMNNAALGLCEKVQTCVMAYVQSDEVSLILRNDKSEKSEPWFENRMQKLDSITASMMGWNFNRRMFCFKQSFDFQPATFDARVIYLPDREEAYNYVLWRQNDCIRNSVSGQAQAHFSQKQLNRKKREEMLEMLHGIGEDWENLKNEVKYGTLIYKKTEQFTTEKEDTVYTRAKFFCDTEVGRFSRDTFDKAYDYTREESNDSSANTSNIQGQTPHRS